MNPPAINYLSSEHREIISKGLQLFLETEFAALFQEGACPNSERRLSQLDALFNVIEQREYLPQEIMRPFYHKYNQMMHIISEAEDPYIDP